MTIRVNCPNPGCGAVASVEEQSLGKRGRCKKCGHVFELARPGGEAASVVSGDASAWKKGPSAPASPTNLPEQFGRYRIMKTLGQGGMGAVYLAHDTKLQREVALKVPYFSPADGLQAVQRFEREARAAATLDHPNLCPVHDVGEIDGIHFLTMPYIKGKPLNEALGQNETLTEAQAASIALKLAQALQEAHEKGIIHRDLKPGNIMVNRRRELIVMDFGLARVVDADDRPITRTGHVLGTALYMAPEQAAGDLAAIGPTADVYSLGVILYELLTGRRPFEGPWSVVIGLKSVKDPEPPSVYRSGLSPALNAICLKAIAKDPKDRYQSMNELAQSLSVFLKSTTSPTLTPSGTTRPADQPESLAAQVFAGIVTQEMSSLREDRSIDQTAPERARVAPPKKPNRAAILSAAGASALLLGVIIYIATGNNGRTIDPSVNTRVSQPKGEKLKEKSVARKPADEPEKVAMNGDEPEVKLAPPASDPPKSEPEPPSTPAMVPEQGKATELAVAAPEPMDVPKTTGATSKTGLNASKKGAGSAYISRIPQDAIRFGANRYKLFAELLTWPEAKRKCEELGGHLVIVNTEEENKFLVSLIQNSIVRELWLGATDEVVEGEWVNVDGSRMQYNSWDKARGQPNNLGENLPEHYVILRSDGLWWDFPDHAIQGYKPGYVCEWEAARVVTVPTPRKGAAKNKAARPADSWRGDRFWTVQGKSIKGVGTIERGQPHTYLYTEKSYKDFELKGRVRLKGGTGNSGIQIRSELVDATKFRVRGPQVDIGGNFWGSLYGEDFPAGNGGMMQSASAELVARIVKPAEFNEIEIRCVGKRLTVKLNGSITIDDVFPQLPDEGRIAWQLHSGNPVDLWVDNFEITDLAAEVEQAAFRSLFNRKDLTGWIPNPNWKVENNLLIGSGRSENYLYTIRNDYKDFHLRAVAQINDRGIGGIIFRIPALKQPDGYKVQIDCTSESLRKTGSLLKIPGGGLTTEAQTATRPDEPFLLEVIARGNQIVVKVNDKVITTYDDNDRPYFSGHIALQHFNANSIIKFSKIEIKELAEETAQAR